MMPNNPEWMTGARACSALAQAICQCFNIQYIVPSDSNLIDGVNVQEAQSVVICGSFNKHLTQIAKLITKLTDKGIEVLSPRSTEIVDVEGDFVVFKNDIKKKLKDSNDPFDAHMLNDLVNSEFIETPVNNNLTIDWLNNVGFKWPVVNKDYLKYIDL